MSCRCSSSAAFRWGCSELLLEFVYEKTPWRFPKTFAGLFFVQTNCVKSINIGIVAMHRIVFISVAAAAVSFAPPYISAKFNALDAVGIAPR